MNSPKNRWIKFAIWGTLYLLWVIWLGNYWWLLGLPVIFDLYITKKVHWAFWRRKNGKSNFILDWIDAIIFALVVAVFIRMFFYEAYVIPSSSMEKSMLVGDYLLVSKIAYGPRVPQTPLSVPLVHNTFMGGESYSTLIQNKYRRLKGFSKVKRGDIVVFGFPNGDTVLQERVTNYNGKVRLQVLPDDYYAKVRLNGREYVEKLYGPVIVRPVDKKDNYVKRCVALPGDTLNLVNGELFVNGVQRDSIEGLQMTYTIYTKGNPINSKVLEGMGIDTEEIFYDSTLPGYQYMSLTKGQAESIAKLGTVVEVRDNIDVYPPDFPDNPKLLFPFRGDYKWTRDNFGPLWVPAKGATVELTEENLPLYERIITAYEHNTLKSDSTGIYINGQRCSQYTFAQDYYFMLGDNRHNSLDSRYWGFVPEDHIVGTPAIIWFSSNKNKSFPSNIRWDRLFKLF